MDFSKYGIKEGAIKAVKIIGYVAASGAIVAIAQTFSGGQIDLKKFLIVAAVGAVNALLGFLQTWLSAHQPSM